MVRRRPRRWTDVPERHRAGHTVPDDDRGLWRDVLHRCDRAMIYLFIAGSYTPWLNLRHLDGVSVELRWAVWLLALLGITYQQLFHERYKALETLFYVVIATLPSLAVLEMVGTLKTFE